MTKEIIFFEPTFKERIWGGEKLKEVFSYDIPYKKTGECWAISAHQHGESVVKEGQYKGLKLSELWNNHRELFGNMKGDSFPLLIKILDAAQDLSVQVHPDDEYANKNENGEFGKTECWYIIDCEEGADLILGHHAQTKEELKEMLEKGQWNEFLRKIKIKPGDFVFVPSGTVHAICEGTLILETQQSSDVTYRIYDYDRLQDDGTKRELHIQQSIDVIEVPHQDALLNIKTDTIEDLNITTFVRNNFFTVERWDLNDISYINQNENFVLCSVIDGEGSINGQLFKKGDHFLIPNTVNEVKLEGKSQLIVSYIEG